MSQDNILLTFIVALVGVIGTGIGIMASLIPIELTGKRDYYQSLVKMWRLLDFEQKALVKHFENPANHLAEAPEPRPIMIAFLPATAWQTVRSNGEFITDAPANLLHTFNASYEMVDRLNAAINQYTIFSATTNIATMPNFPDRVRGFHTIINTQYSVLAIQFHNLEGQIAQQIKILEGKTRIAQKWIDGLKWFAWVVFGSVLIASVVLVLIFVLHR